MELTLIYLFLWFWLSLAPSSCLFFYAVSKNLTQVYITLVNTSDNFIEDSAFLPCSLSAKYWTKLFWRLLFKSRQWKCICLLLFKPDRLYRLQSKLHLSWPSSFLYTITLSFPCINWLLENSLKNVLFFIHFSLFIFIGQVRVPTSNSDFFSYIPPGHTFRCLQRNLFHTPSKTELKYFFSGCCFHLKYLLFQIGIFAYFLPYANSASMVRSWSDSSL